MSTLEEQIRQLDAAISAQEALRPTLGDAVVDLSIKALKTQRAQLKQELYPPVDDNQWLNRMQSYLPTELAAKIRGLGRIEGERRQVTILFADVSGFTALSELLDPEEVTTIMNDALQEMAKSVYDCEGYIDKFIGDAVMAVFGAPIAHENDPERALRAALAMREKMDGINRRWEHKLPKPLTLHIGINTGLVIAGMVGSDARMSYTMMGDSVNIAARLQDAAQSQQILVSRTTYRLTQTAFIFTVLEPIQVKGKQESLVVYELIGSRRNPEKQRGLKDLHDVFLGREHELTKLQEFQVKLQHGHGHIVVISGDAGIGKSRLLAEWHHNAISHVTWLEGRAFQHTSSLPYGPFLDLLRRNVGIKDEDSEAQARKRFDSALQRLINNDQTTPIILAFLLGLNLHEHEQTFLDSLSDEDIRQYIREALLTLILHTSNNQPLVLVLEDMHWADTSSLELIEHLLLQLQSYPIILTIVLRSYIQDMPNQLKTYFENLAQQQWSHLALQPLTQAQSMLMIQQLLDQSSLPERLQHILTAKAEGNPFFVEELLRMLIERAALIRDPEQGWIATDILEHITVPDTLQGVLMARLDRLYPETKWVLQQASVIGRIFLYRVLLYLEDTRDMDTDLSLLEREELIRERNRDPELEYIFKHALTQEVAYKSLLVARRKELHRRTAEAIEYLFADRLSEFYPILAKHFTEGEVWESAVHYLIKSGDMATRLYAHHEAREHYKQALQAFEYLPDSDEWRRSRIDTVIKLSKVSLVAEEPQINLDRLDPVEPLAQELLQQKSPNYEDRMRLARIHYWMGTFHILKVGGFPKALSYFAKVLPVAEETNDIELLIVPSMITGRGMTVSGQFKEACPLFERIIPLLEQNEDWTEWILTKVFLGLAQAACGKYTQGLQQIHIAHKKANDLNNMTGQVYGFLFLAAASYHGGDIQQMLIASQQTFQAAERSGDRLYEYFGSGYQAWAYSRLDNHTAAKHWLKICLDLGQELGGQLVLSDWFAAAEAEITLRAGDPEKAQVLAQACIHHVVQHQRIFAEGVAERVLAQSLMSLNSPDIESIESHLARSVEAFIKGGASLEAARTYAVWAELCQNTGNCDAAQRYTEAAITPLLQAELIEEAERIRTHVEIS